MSKDNKLGIADEAQLARKEEELSKKKNVELFEKGILGKLKAGSSDALIKIHKHLFDEIYDYAGQIRTTDTDKFTPANQIKDELEKINKMPQKTIDEIIEKYVAMNMVHPFASGNGRATRIWLDVMTRKELKQTVDWSKIDKDSFLMAIEMSPVNQTDIKSIVKSALSQELSDREVYTHSIDANFKFDDYDVYRTRVLG